MLRGGEGLDLAVAAVVVRDEQAGAGDDLRGAAAAELDDGVLDGRMVDAVDLVGGEAGAEVAERVCVHFLQQREQPHAFIGPEGGRREHQRGREGNQDTFHADKDMLFLE